MLPAATGYGYNKTAHRYYDLETGQFVSKSDIRDGLENLMDLSALRMNNLSEKLVAGEISLADWQRGMMGEIKAANVASSALANGGWAQMTQSDWGKTGQLVKEQYQYVRNFAQEIADGKQPLDGRFMVRTDLYGDAPNGTYETMRGRAMELDGYEEEIADLEPGADHCDGCLQRAAQGWQPIGTLSDIGDEDCQARDRCTKRYRRQTDGGGWEESE